MDWIASESNSETRPPIGTIYILSGEGSTVHDTNDAISDSSIQYTETGSLVGRQFKKVSKSNPCKV